MSHLPKAKIPEAFKMPLWHCEKNMDINDRRTGYMSSNYHFCRYNSVKQEGILGKSTCSDLEVWKNLWNKWHPFNNARVQSEKSRLARDNSVKTSSGHFIKGMTCLRVWSLKKGLHDGGECHNQICELEPAVLRRGEPIRRESSKKITAWVQSRNNEDLI